MKITETELQEAGWQLVQSARGVAWIDPATGEAMEFDQAVAAEQERRARIGRLPKRTQTGPEDIYI